MSWKTQHSCRNWLLSSAWVFVQDCVTNTLANKEAKKKLSPTNAKALNTMRQRLKKHNIPYQDAIDKIKENPEIPTESESEGGMSSGSDESSDEEEVAAKGVRPPIDIIVGSATKPGCGLLLRVTIMLGNLTQ